MANELETEHGFYYHFLDMSTGRRWRKCELSSIDTTLLVCGALTARQYFNDAEIQDLATKIYARVDWPWMLNKGYAFSMGWTPENGFCGQVGSLRRNDDDVSARNRVANCSCFTGDMESLQSSQGYLRRNHIYCG